MKILQVLLLGVTVSAMTSDPSFYSQVPMLLTRDARRPQDHLPRTMSYLRPTPTYSTPSVSIGRPYDVDYTGRQLRYRSNSVPQVNYDPLSSFMSPEQMHYYPDNTPRAALYSAPGQPRYDNDAMFGRSADLGTNYRKMSYEAPHYADDQGRISGRYLTVGNQRGRTYPTRGYLDDAVQ